MQQKVQNIILDLGGVIIDVDPERTIEAFKQLGASNIERFYNDTDQSTLFDELETGAISPERFREVLREELQLRDASDEALDRAWQAMLIDIPRPRFDLLEELRSDYRLYVLSNTNTIHIAGFADIVERVYGYDAFLCLFDRVHYSQELGFRKPHETAFQRVIDLNELDPGATLFIDDNKGHLEGARKSGLQTLHHPPEEELDAVISHLAPPRRKKP